MLRQATPTPHPEKETQKHGIYFEYSKANQRWNRKKEKFPCAQEYAREDATFRSAKKAVHHLSFHSPEQSLRLSIYASSSNIFHGGPFTGVSLSSLYPQHCPDPAAM